MAGSYSVKAILSAKDSGFTSTLKGATSATESLASKLKSGLGFGVLAGIGQQAFSTLTNGAKELLSEITASNTAWKTFEGNMKILGKGEKEINSVKKTLQDYAQTTIYSSSDMASSYAQLAAVGIKSADKLVTGFGGLAGAAEDPAQAMKTLSQQGVQMAAKPKVAWQDFKLMLEQTPAGMAAVAKKMGMTTSQLVTAIQDGDVATKDFFAAVQAVGNSDGFTKLATEYKSIDQAMDGLKETVGNKLLSVFDAFSQKGISVISKLIDVIGGIDGQAIADKIMAGVGKIEALFAAVKKTGAFKVLADAIKNVRSVLSGCLKTWSGFIGGTEGASKAIATVIKGLAWLIGKAGQAVAYITRLVGAIKETGAFTAFKNALVAIKDALFTVFTTVSQCAPSVQELGTTIGNAIKKIANATIKIAEFIKGLDPKVIKAFVAAVAGFKVIKTVAPFVSSFASSIGNIASKVGGGLAAKLFGTAKAQDAVGKSSAASGTQMLTAAKAFALMGVGVLAIAVGFALLAQSAIALAKAGGGAIAVMAAMVVAVVGLGIGMAALMKSLAPMSGQLMPVAMAFLVMGAAVLLIATGFALLAFASIALAAAGWGAIAVMAAMIVVIALLAIGAAALGTALTAGAVGFLAFGAAVLMVGAGFALIGVAALLAAASLQIIVALLPALTAAGLQGAGAITALGAALLVFAIGAGAAGIACALLGAGLLVLAAGFLVVAVAALISAAALALIGLLLPLINQHGMQGATVIVTLAASLVVFATGAIAAGSAALVLAATIVAATVGFVAAAAVVAVLAAAMVLIAGSAAIAGAGFAAMGNAIAIINAQGWAAAAVLTAISPQLIAFAPSATIAGAAAAILAAAFLAASIVTLAFGAAIILLATGIAYLGVSSIIAAVGLAMLSISLKLITANVNQNVVALAVLGVAFAVFGAGAMVAGVAALMFATGMLAAAVAVAALGISVVVLAAGLIVLAVSFIAVALSLALAAGGIALLNLVLPITIQYGAAASMAMMMLSAGLIALGAGAMIAGAGLLVFSAGLITATASIIVFGAGMLTASAGMLVMVAALSGVNASMSSIGSNARSTEKALKNMSSSISAVKSGLTAIGDIAKAAMDKLTDSLDDSASQVKSAGKKVGTGLTKGMQNGLNKAPAVATKATMAVSLRLMAGKPLAHAAGSYIAIGFAQGMLSQLAIIKRAAAQMVAAADKAVQAKAKIHSPSKLFYSEGDYCVDGFVNSLKDGAKRVWDAAENLVAIPQIASPVLAGSYNGELSADYEYSRNAKYTIYVPLSVDGREFARAEATYVQDELDRQQMRENRKRGKV